MFSGVFIDQQEWKLIRELPASCSDVQLSSEEPSSKGGKDNHDSKKHMSDVCQHPCACLPERCRAWSSYFSLSAQMHFPPDVFLHASAKCFPWQRFCIFSCSGVGGLTANWPNTAEFRTGCGSYVSICRNKNRHTNHGAPAFRRKQRAAAQALLKTVITPIQWSQYEKKRVSCSTLTMQVKMSSPAQEVYELTMHQSIIPVYHVPGITESRHVSQTESSMNLF